ncbi:hypothetical protein E8E12_000929 [Didymella heteroderae]|uniref:Uncharacterized protein n=1 Tax=Didymella heteroderae TaxID=1769908 RepID=A0A9P4WL27_9PLEO|nr:hypothetical protein E8E12_000929 [Didymella heteroderae]
MAPYPESTAAETPGVQPNPDEEPTLPGMKRGIAIGVACSVFIIMVALLAFFAYRRRKQQVTKTKHTQLGLEEPMEMDAGTFWPPPQQEKNQQVYTAPIEADVHVVHELDGSGVPELPGNFEGQMLANKKTPRTSYHDGDDNASIQDHPHRWIGWTLPSIDVPAQPMDGHTGNHNPYLEVVPSRQATSVSPVVGSGPFTSPQNISFNVSPIAPSPLEEVYISSGFPRQQRYYDYPKVST